MDKITVAVPCYNEEPVLDLFYSAITAVAKEFPDTEFEFLFIDDGSRDNTLGKVQSFAQKDSRNLRRAGKRHRRLCRHYGCRSSGSAVPAA